MKKSLVVLLVIIWPLLACNKTEDLINLSKPELLFSSGFEEGTFLTEPIDGYEIVRGKDENTGFTWPIHILGSDFAGIHRIQDDGGPAIDNYIEKVIGPLGEESAALFQRVNYDIGLTQTPYQINNIKQNPDELYMSYWMKTDDTSLTGPEKWRALWEFKTKNYNVNTSDGFRMIAFMATDSNGDLHWLFQGDRNPANPIWQEKNTTVPVIRNEWFKVEYYIKWGTSSDGYATMKVNGQLIAEHFGPTTSNSDDLDFIILTQVYGNTHPMHQWIDNIEIWNKNPN